MTGSNSLRSEVNTVPLNLFANAKAKQSAKEIRLIVALGSSGFMGISTANSNQNPLGATVTALPCRQ